MKRRDLCPEAACDAAGRKDTELHFTELLLHATVDSPSISTFDAHETAIFFYLWMRKMEKAAY